MRRIQKMVKKSILQSFFCERRSDFGHHVGSCDRHDKSGEPVWDSMRQVLHLRSRQELLRIRLCLLFGSCVLFTEPVSRWRLPWRFGNFGIMFEAYVASTPTSKKKRHFHLTGQSHDYLQLWRWHGCLKNKVVRKIPVLTFATWVELGRTPTISDAVPRNINERCSPAVRSEWSGRRLDESEGNFPKKGK